MPSKSVPKLTSPLASTPKNKTSSVSIIFTSLIVLLIYLYFHQDHISPPPNMTTHDSDILSALHVTLTQASASPPAITITVINTSPQPLTLLTWDSPLDPLALQLGLLTITATDSSTTLDIPTMKVSRKLPPTDACLVGLAPGESLSNHVVFREGLVPMEELKGKTLSVKAKGRWTRVWLLAREELTAEMVEELGAGGNAVAGEFETDSIEIEVE